MMRLCLTLLAVLSVASAFTTPQPRFSAASVSSKPLFMFSAEDGEKSASASKGLAEVAPGDSADALQTKTMEETEKEEAFKRPGAKTMMVKSRNNGELYEVEMNESFLANESFEMNWWAWVGFVIFPLILLTNDVFHYLPKDGPLGFLGRF